MASLVPGLQIGVQEGTLGNWVNKYRAEHTDDEPPLTLPEQGRPRELERTLVVLPAGDRDNRRRRLPAPDLARRLDAVHHREHDVHQPDVGAKRGGELGALAPVGSPARDLRATARLQELRQRRGEGIVVLNQKHRQGRELARRRVLPRGIEPKVARRASPRAQPEGLIALPHLDSPRIAA